MKYSDCENPRNTYQTPLTLLNNFIMP